MKKKLEKPVLAEGETTGHAHVLDGNVDVYEEKGIRSFDTKENVTVKHEEHGPITLTPGKYESDKVVEYDPFAQAARKVAD